MGVSLNHMYRSRTGKCTEIDSFTACAYLCTEVDLYRNRLPFVPNTSCTEMDPLRLYSVSGIEYVLKRSDHKDLHQKHTKIYLNHTAVSTNVKIFTNDEKLVF